MTLTRASNDTLDLVARTDFEGPVFEFDLAGLEIGCAESVQVASTRLSSGAGRIWASSPRPTPRACSPGSTNSIDRNHRAPRSTAEPNATVRLRPARQVRSATTKRDGSVASVCAWRRRRLGLSVGSGGKPIGTR